MTIPHITLQFLSLFIPSRSHLAYHIGDEKDRQKIKALHHEVHRLHTWVDIESTESIRFRKEAYSEVPC